MKTGIKKVIKEEALVNKTLEGGEKELVYILSILPEDHKK